MKTSGNTVLISGGSAGIGFEIARSLSEKGNTVIITGRDKTRLEKAASQLKNVHTLVCDVSAADDVTRLAGEVISRFPGLNLLINNAGKAFLYDISENNVNAMTKAEEEMLTNYLSVIRLNEKLLPLLKKQQEAAIVNVSSIVAFVPGRLATYSASKAALHSYSQSLRLVLVNSPVKVFELMPPLVNTEFSESIGGSKGIPPSRVAEEFLSSFEKNIYEIHVGATADLYKLYLSSPSAAFNRMNGIN